VEREYREGTNFANFEAVFGSFDDWRHTCTTRHLRPGQVFALK